MDMGTKYIFINKKKNIHLSTRLRQEYIQVYKIYKALCCIH